MWPHQYNNSKMPWNQPKETWILHLSSDLQLSCHKFQLEYAIEQYLECQLKTWRWIRNHSQSSDSGSEGQDLSEVCQCRAWNLNQCRAWQGIFNITFTVGLFWDCMIANEKYYAKWTAAKIFIIKHFESAMWSQNLVAEQQDGRLGVQNDPPCTSMCLCVPMCDEERICRKGKTKFLCCYFAVYI